MPRELLVRVVAPEILAHTLVQAFGKSLGQPVGQRLEHDGRVVVVAVLEQLFPLVDADAGGDGEGAHVVRGHALGRDEIGQAAAGARHAVDLVLFGLLAQAEPGQGDLRARLVGVELDVVVVHAVGGPQAHDCIGREPAALDQALEHLLAVGMHAQGLGAHHFVAQDGGDGAGQVPGLEEGAPVDVVGQFRQVEVAQHTPADELGHGRGVATPG